MQKYDISSLTISEITALFADFGQKNFRAKQVFSWLNKNLCEDFSEMSNISKEFREILDQNFSITKSKILRKLESLEDGTIKYLFNLEKNSIIESVLMRYEFGNSVCISTQAGCKMGCSFCASALNGFDRNLTAGEMLAQVYHIQKDIGERISNVVLMGSGEPLDNFENVLKFIEIINAPEGLALGRRHITISTCGIVPKIYELADLKIQANLAISLHAPNDEIRQKTMPIANTYSIQEILEACKYYSTKTGRRITYEYALIDGFNNSKEHAKELASKLKGSLSYVNLIPVNDVSEKGYLKPAKENILNFYKTLKNFGVEATIRRTLGSDINAACGQLRANYIKEDIKGD